MVISLIDRLFRQQEKQQEGTPKNIKHNRQDIAGLLLLYKKHNYHLTAIMKDTQRRKLVRMATGIEAVEVGRNEFLIDEFTPPPPEQIHPGTKLLFSLTHNGVRHQLEAAFRADNGTKRWFGFPQGIEQIQLRNAFRVKISQAHPIKVRLKKAEQKMIEGTLADLSSTGLRLRLKGMVKPRPERGEVYSSCHFVLGDGSTVEAPAQLMHWQFDHEQQVSYLGLQFEQMDTTIQKALNRYLTDLQRKQRQLS